jgi:hypothetical protein
MIPRNVRHDTVIQQEPSRDLPDKFRVSHAQTPPAAVPLASPGMERTKRPAPPMEAAMPLASPTSTRCGSTRVRGARAVWPGRGRV